MLRTLGYIAQVPDSDATEPADLSGPIEDLIGYAKYIGFSVCVLAMIAAGLMLAVQSRRGDGMEAASGPIKVMIAAIIIGSSAALVNLFV